MPLVLARTPGQGFTVGHDRKFTITRIASDVSFYLRDEASGREMCITESKTEIMPQVFASAGIRLQTQLARVAIEAPREISIARSELLEQS